MVRTGVPLPTRQVANIRFVEKTAWNVSRMYSANRRGGSPYSRSTCVGVSYAVQQNDKGFPAWPHYTLMFPSKFDATLFGTLFANLFAVPIFFVGTLARRMFDEKKLYISISSLCRGTVLSMSTNALLRHMLCLFKLSNRGIFSFHMR